MNLGRSYPRSIHADYTALPAGINGWCLPRRIIYTSDNFGVSGTLLTPWVSQTIMSTVAEMVDGESQVFYRIDHPSVDDNYFLVIFELAEMPPDNNPMWGLRITWEFWYSGIKKAYYVAPTPFTGEYFTEPGFGFIAWNEFPNSVNLSEVNYLTLSHLNVAVWADDPDYQPYHTRP